MSTTDASTATTTDTVEPENSSNTIVEQEEEEEDNFVDAHDTFPEDDNRNYEADAEVDDEEEDQFEDTVEDMYEEDDRQLLPNMCSVEDKIDTDLSDDNDDGTSLTAPYGRDGAISDCSLTIPDSSSVAAVSAGASIKKNNKKQKKNQKPSDDSFVAPEVTSATTNESSFLSGPLSIPDGSLATPGDDDHYPSHMPRVLPDGRELLFSWSSSPSTAGGAVSGSIAADSVDPVNSQNNNNNPMIKNNRAASDGYFGLKDMASLKQQVMGIFSSGKVKNGDTRDSEKDNADGNKDGDKVTVEDNRNGNNGEAERKKKNNKKSKKKKAKKDQ